MEEWINIWILNLAANLNTMDRIRFLDHQLCQSPYTTPEARQQCVVTSSSVQHISLCYAIVQASQNAGLFTKAQQHHLNWCRFRRKSGTILKI